MKIDKNYLHEMYNATSTDNGKGEIETYKNWLERQLISRTEQLSKADVSGSLPSDSEVMKAAKDYVKECYAEKRQIAEAGFIACWKWFRAWRQ